MTRLRVRRPALLALVALVLVAGVAGGTYAAFSSQTANGGNNITAATDYRAPAITAVAVGKSQGGTPGYVKQGGSYYVYANVSADTGNPATGISTVRADASNVTAGQSSVAMSAGSWTVGAQTYNYRTASLTANAALGAGSKAFSVTATDNNSNSGTSNNNLTVDNTAPTASDVQSADGGGTAGQAETGDTITYTFSEPIEPGSILAGWTGGAQAVAVRLNNSAPDTVQIYDSANTAQLPLGTLALNGTYTNSNRTFTASSMTMTGNTVVVTLGTPNGAVKKEKIGAAMVWTPSTTPYDRAANAMAATPATESGTPLNVEF